MHRLPLFHALSIATLSLLWSQDFLHAGAPEYKGRSLDGWLNDVTIYRTSFIDGMVAAKDAAKQRAAAEAILVIGKDAVPELVHRLKEPPPNDIDCIARTLWAFDVLGAQAKAAVPDLIRLLSPSYEGAGVSDPSQVDHTSGNAAEALCAIGKDARAALIAALSDKDQTIRFGAAMALERLGDKTGNVSTALIKSLSDHDWMVRWRAARTIGSIGEMPKIAVPALMQTLRTDPNDNVRSYAILALEKFGHDAEGAVPELQKLASGSQPSVAMYAREAIEEIRLPKPSAPQPANDPEGLI